jgi:hypothetical protein
MSRRCLAALFAADAANDHSSDSILNQPDVEPTSDKRTVAAFIENRIRFEGELLERNDISGRQGKRPGVFHMEDLHDRYVSGLGTVNERLQMLDEERHIGIAPIGPMPERFLDVNHEKRGFYTRHKQDLPG